MFRTYRMLVGLFATVVFLRLVLFLGLALLQIQDRCDITFPEGARVYAVRRVAAGLPLYQDFRQLPHAMVPYGPLYFYIAGWLDRALGSDPFDSYLVGRSVSFACFLLLSLICMTWARQISGGWFRGAIVAALAAACPITIGPSIAVQSDSLAILSVTTALWVASRSWSRWRWGCVWLLALIAWTAKQNSVAMAPALAAWLLDRSGWRAAARWSIAWLAGVALLWGLFDWTTNGSFTLNALVSIKRPVAMQFGSQVLADSLPFAGVGFLVDVLGWPAARYTASASLPAWWFLFAAVQGTLSCFGEGGGANYLMEAWIAACLIVSRLLNLAGDGSQLPDSMAVPRVPSMVMRGAGLILLSLVCLRDAVVFHSVNLAQHLIYLQRTPPAVRLAGRLPYLERFARLYPGTLLVQYSYLAVIAPQPPVVLDVVHYRLMVEAGVIRVDLLVECLERGDFEFLILRDQLAERYDATEFMRWPEPVWQAMKKNYRLAMPADGQFVYTLREVRE